VGIRRDDPRSSDQRLLEGGILVQRERAKALKEMTHNNRFFFFTAARCIRRRLDKARQLSGSEAQTIVGNANVTAAAARPSAPVHQAHATPSGVTP
jgi:hypothetical protein